MRTVLSLLTCFFLMTATMAQDAKLDTLVGNWEGILQVATQKLRIAFTLKKDDKGSLTGSMISIDQGNVTLPLDKITLTEGEAKFTITKAAITYRAKLNEQGDELTGHWLQGRGKYPLNVKKVKEVSSLKRPQEPKPPFPYKEEEVSYENAAAKVKLAGTFTIPQGKGPFPAVLLITGSGAQDRNETLLGHKPFLVLADALTRRGIAVLRVDDRGTDKSTGDFAKATSFDFADDAMAGVQFLKTRPEVDVKHIGLMGHSEGGIIAPLVASRSKDVAFIVLLAGTGLTGEEIVCLQGKLINMAEGAKTEEAARGEAIQRKLFALVKAEPGGPELTKKLNELLKAEVEKLNPEEKKSLDKTGGINAAKAQLGMLSSPWFKTFIIHDPAPVLKKVKCPVLAVNGELDLQVPYKENLEAIRQALTEGGNPDFTIKSFPQLNHLFQKCKTGSPTEYVNIEETLNAEVLQVVGDWILTRTK